MAQAEFEEREFEAPLYRELQGNDHRLWAPGQVLENWVGFDRALFVASAFPFDLYSLAPPVGVMLSRWRHLFPAPVSRRGGRSFPNFELNLFLQAKRPSYGTRPPRAVHQQGVRGRYWRFGVDSEQQAVLKAVSDALAGSALVAYAAPAFHKERDLYRHICSGTVAASSTFPSANVLDGHGAWYYAGPGATGVARSEPRSVEERPLSTRLSELLEAAGPRPTVETGEAPPVGLAELANRVRSAMGSDSLGDTFRRARFFQLVRELEGPATRDIDDATAAWLVPYATVFAFVHVFRLTWHVVSAAE